MKIRKDRIFRGNDDEEYHYTCPHCKASFVTCCYGDKTFLKRELKKKKHRCGQCEKFFKIKKYKRYFVYEKTKETEAIVEKVL
jgi:transcription elongation factor Elf1